MGDGMYPPAGLLQGKVALVTGAGRGIGKVIAKTFLAEGAKVLAVDFSGEEKQTAAELGPDVVACHADVSREADVQAMFARVLDAFGRLDASIHVAGNPGGRWGEEITVEEYEAFTSVHLKGTLLCCKHAVKAMAPSGGGAIVNFSSAAAFNHYDRISFVYSAAKAGVNSLTKSFASYYGRQGIRANAIAPGFTLSEKQAQAPAEVHAALSGKAALGRAADPAETAAVAVFLASDRSSFVTGVTIPVDGGWTARLA